MIDQILFYFDSPYPHITRKPCDQQICTKLRNNNKWFKLGQMLDHLQKLLAGKQPRTIKHIDANVYTFQ